MRRQTKIWLITAASLTVLGLLLFTAAMAAHGWDFIRLSTEKREINTYPIREAFSDISINTGTADILFVPSEDGICKVVCDETEKVKHTVAVQSGVLTVSEVNEKEWYDYVGISFGTPKITVYLPETKYASLIIREDTGSVEIPKDFQFGGIDILTSTGDVKNWASALGTVKIGTNTGDITVEDISANTVALSVSTGRVIAESVTSEGNVVIQVNTGDGKLTDIVCGSLLSTGSTGDLVLKNVIAAEQISVERSTGDVEFDGADAAEIFVETDTGDVTGSLRTGKVFIIQTDTGDVDVPKTEIGGKCEIVTDTGDISISIQQ